MTCASSLPASRLDAEDGAPESAARWANASGPVIMSPSASHLRDASTVFDPAPWPLLDLDL